MVDTEKICTIWLTTVFGYGSKLPAQLIEKFGSAYNVYENGRYELQFGAMAQEIKSAFENKDLSYAEYIYEKCQRDGVQIICIQQSAYPKLLREIPNPPVVLYYTGNLDLLSDMPFTVVGSRKIDEEGRRLVMDFVPDLQQAGFKIVSGFAEGAEAYIHKNVHPTVAVLPNGINVCYPVNNFPLKESIIQQGGLIITEFMHDVRAFKGNFYLRNRLLAGMSYGVLVIQAPLKSGTSITATAAGDYGRQVYAVPGSLYNPRFRGSIELLRNGAIPVSDPDQIISDYAPIYDKITLPVTLQNLDSPGFVDLKDEKYDVLDEDERNILSCLNGNCLHIDEITVQTGLDISLVNAALTMLEIQDFVVRLDGNHYIIK